MTRTDTEPRWFQAARWTPLLLAGILAIHAFADLPTRVIDHDEVQHLHIAWRIAEGDRPYLDFADNHNHLFPQALLWTLPEGDDPGSALVLARVFMASCTLLTLLLAGLLARHWSRTWLALLVPAALAGSGFWMLYGGTVRPDVPMTTLVTGGWLLFAMGRRRGAPALLFAAGLAWGLGAAVLLKAALALIPASALLLVDLVHPRTTRRSALLSGLACLGGLLLPLGVFVAWTASQGLLGGFWFWVVEFNRAYLSPSATDQGFSVREVLTESAALDLALILVFAAGLTPAMLRARRDGVLVAILAYVALTLASTLGINQPNYQYLLPALTLLPVLGAAGLDPLVDSLKRRAPHRAAWLLPATIVAVTAASIPGVLWLSDLPDNNGQISRMERVLELVPPDRTVLASPPAHPILRRDALYLWFNNPRFHNTLTRLGDQVPPEVRHRWAGDPDRLSSQPPDVILKTGARYHSAYGVGALAAARYMALSADPEILVLDTRIREIMLGATGGSGAGP